jgi:hypothetical protein
MLKAFYDDSGQHEQVVGGCLASEEVWMTVDARWALVLTDYNLKWFHATDFEKPNHRDYSHLSALEKDQVFDTLLALLADSIGLQKRSGGFWGAYLCGIVPRESIGILRSMDDRDRGHRKGKPQPASRRERFFEDWIASEHDPYCVALGLCFRRTLDECGVSPENKVHLLVAHQPGKTGKIDWVYSVAKRNPRWCGLLGELSNGPQMDPHRVRPLQAADFVAYYLGKSKRKPDDPRALRAAERLRPNFISISSKLGVTEGWAS